MSSLKVESAPLSDPEEGSASADPGDPVPDDTPRLSRPQHVSTDDPGPSAASRVRGSLADAGLEIRFDGARPND